jgi:hypothetical protein
MDISDPNDQEEPMLALLAASGACRSQPPAHPATSRREEESTDAPDATDTLDPLDFRIAPPRRRLPRGFRNRFGDDDPHRKRSQRRRGNPRIVPRRGHGPDRGRRWVPLVWTAFGIAAAATAAVWWISRRIRARKMQPAAFRRATVALANPDAG